MKKSGRISLRITRGIKEQLQKICKENHTTQTRFLIRVIEDYPVTPKRDERAIHEFKEYHLELEKLEDVKRALVRTGVNLNQVTRKLNSNRQVSLANVIAPLVNDYNGLYETLNQFENRLNAFERKEDD